VVSILEFPSLDVEIDYLPDVLVIEKNMFGMCFFDKHEVCFSMGMKIENIIYISNPSNYNISILRTKKPKIFIFKKGLKRSIG
jgi:hypothetical protein